MYFLKEIAIENRENLCIRGKNLTFTSEAVWKSQNKQITKKN